MKRAIQLFALLLASVIILTGCGKGGGVSHGINEPEPIGDPVQNGVEGNVVKGMIAGATVTVVDANGDVIPGASATSAADGSYSIEFTPTNTPIPQPIHVIIDGTGATSVCDVDNPGTDDDCMNADGTYSAFGGTFTLPSGFELRAVLAALPEPVPGGVQATVNPNPFTEMAAAIALAGGATLTTADVDDANATVLGIVQLLFPTIDVNAELAAGNFNLNNIPIPDITDLSNENTSAIGALSYAMAALSGTFIALVDPDDADFSDLNQVIATISADFTSGVTNGDLAIIGRAASAVFDTIVDELTAIDDVVLPDDLSLDDLGGVADDAGSQAIILRSDPDVEPTIPDVDVPPVIPTDEEFALVASKAFISLLADLLNDFVDLTDLTDNGAVAASSPLGLGDAQYRWIQNVYSDASTAAFDNLVHGIDSAARLIKLGQGTGDNSDTITETGATLSYTVVGTEDIDGSTFTVTDATSVSGTVTLTIASGTRTIVEVDGDETGGTMSATGVTLVTTADADGGTLQTFTGSMDLTYATESNGMGSLSVDGNVHVAAVTGGTAGSDWGVKLDLTNVIGVNADDFSANIAGSYSATFNVAITGEDELIITLAGTRADGTGTLNFSITLGDQTFNGSVTSVEAANGDITDTTILTDVNESVTLTLTTLFAADGATSVTGVLSSQGIQTGTMDANGTITYADDTIQNLNAALFN